MLVAMLAVVVAGILLTRKGEFSDSQETETVLVSAQETSSETIFDFQRRVDQLINHDDYSQLDDLADRVRREDLHLVGGISADYLFARVLAGQSIDKNYWQDADFDNISKNMYNERIAHLEAWQRTNPASNLPTVALALLWRNYAWQARGHDYANKLTKDQIFSFRNGISSEENVLANMVATDARAYNALLTFQRDKFDLDGRAAKLAKIQVLYEAAVKLSPRSFYLYVQHAEALQPRWFGQTGDLAVYADSLLRNPGGDIGLMAYAFVGVEQLSGNFQMRDLLKKAGLKWSKIKQGFQIREQEYGLSDTDWNIFFYLACAAEDRSTALSASKHVGEKWSAWLWRDFEFFSRNVRWAQS